MKELLYIKNRKYFSSAFKVILENVINEGITKGLVQPAPFERYRGKAWLWDTGFLSISLSLLSLLVGEDEDISSEIFRIMEKYKEKVSLFASPSSFPSEFLRRFSSFQLLRFVELGKNKNGMISHMVFPPGSVPEYANSSRSLVTQPPNLSLALYMHKNAFVDNDTAYRALPILLNYHKFLLQERFDSKMGLIYAIHSWETGLDTLPAYLATEELLCMLFSSPKKEIEGRKVYTSAEISGDRPGREEYGAIYFQLRMIKEKIWWEFHVKMFDPLMNALFFLSSFSLDKICEEFGNDGLHAWEKMGEISCPISLISIPKYADEIVREHFPNYEKNLERLDDIILLLEEKYRHSLKFKVRENEATIEVEISEPYAGSNVGAILLGKESGEMERVGYLSAGFKVGNEILPVNPVKYSQGPRWPFFLFLAAFFHFIKNEDKKAENMLSWFFSTVDKEEWHEFSFVGVKGYGGARRMTWTAASFISALALCNDKVIEKLKDWFSDLRKERFLKNLGEL